MRVLLTINACDIYALKAYISIFFFGGNSKFFYTNFKIANNSLTP